MWMSAIIKKTTLGPHLILIFLVIIWIQNCAELNLSFYLTAVWRIVGEPRFQEIVEKTLSQAFKVILPAASVVSGVSPLRGNRKTTAQLSGGNHHTEVSQRTGKRILIIFCGHLGFTAKGSSSSSSSCCPAQLSSNENRTINQLMDRFQILDRARVGTFWIQVKSWDLSLSVSFCLDP